jgi:protease-4
MEYRDATARPVYVYMDRIAASGGYYISMASEGRVFANRNCITASIGVTMGYINVHGLIEDLGIRDFSITSGEHKDIMSMFKEDVDTDNLILQSMVDEYFDRFAEIVALGRDMSDSEVRAVADGRIMTATQALDAGLIDDVMTYSEVLDYIRGELGANINIYQPATAPDFWSSLFGFVAQTRTQSDAQAIISALEQRGNGRFMYHATIS